MTRLAALLLLWPATVHALCGDGVLDQGEHCDDGNTTSGDWCDSQCATGVDVTGASCSEDGLAARLAVLYQAGGADLGTVVDLPTGARIRLCDDSANPNTGIGLRLTQRTWLRGNGARLIVPRDLTAIQIELAAGFSRIDGLSISYPAGWITLPGPPQRNVPVPHGGIGINVRAGLVQIDNVQILYPGIGIRAHGALPLSAVSGLGVSNTYIYACSSHGVWINGGDANGGVFTRLAVLACTNEARNAVAMWEDSFLGNTHLANLYEANDIAVRVTQGASQRSTFLGVYNESSDAVDMRSSNGQTVIGGQLSARRSEVTRGARVGGLESHLQFQGPDAHGHVTFVEIPHVNVSTGVISALAYFGRLPFGNACSVNVPCTDPLDACVTGLCRRQGPGNDYWWLRPFGGGPGSYQWEIYSTNGAAALRWGVEDRNQDGYIREAYLSVGAAPWCGEVRNWCGP